ncbi:hypothetical protein GJ633_15160 [Halorubrum sp. CBA1125]|uniref:nucleotidyl transferase AbiEii/AbiGii toxin family protein n=1 Tax=Halorubrum sp. CBA1125 TaxID=2668072 RepID=UPI00135ED028|nr:nucleotidyl transferase AbiEii/AbiGii toxin family protein [Halorubrum sp. CBA1125]MUW15806.1 hypothetical protein [Halorubrum sp. CBA1125]
MVRQYYVPQVTELSEQELQTVFEAAEPPVCLLGGWAVHLHVNPGFQSEHGREYIGSRDIDLGVHVDSGWGAEELSETPVGESISAIEDFGYTKSRFGFVQNFLRDSQERIGEDQANEYSMHEVFQVYVDVIPDTVELEVFRDVFGFMPPAEPLLEPVFEDDRGEPLSEYVSWLPSNEKEIVPPELLAAMKIRSLPDRDKSHKRVKDVADLHALLWYIKDYNEMKTDVLEFVSDSDLGRLEDAIDETVFEDAAQLLMIDQQLIADSIKRLLR